VQTYVFESSQSKKTLKRQFLSAVSFASMYFLGMLTFTYLWPSPLEKQESFGGIALKTILISVFWGVGMSFVPEKTPDCRLLVDDHSMTCETQYGGWMRWYKIRKTVSAGKVRTIHEIRNKLGMPAGLAASERSGLGAWMWGGVYIPYTLPEYAQLKALVESWKAPELRD
jgi:hypothetical protein